MKKYSARNLAAAPYQRMISIVNLWFIRTFLRRKENTGDKVAHWNIPEKIGRELQIDGVKLSSVTELVPCE